MATPIDPNFWLDLYRNKVEQPDIIRNLIDSYENPASPQGQLYDPNALQSLTWDKPVIVGSPGQTYTGPSDGISIPDDYDLNTGYIIGSPGDVAVKQGRLRPFTPSVTPQPQAQPQAGSQPNAPTPATQPENESNLPTGIEEYMKYFTKTLGAEPELDKKKRNQLALVAMINALGQGVKQVVDYHGRTKHGSPIYPEQNNITPALLAQYEKEYQDYQQRKDKYDLLKTGAMQDAFRYAYGDEQYRKQIEDRWAMQKDEQTYRTNERADDRKYADEQYQIKKKDAQDAYDQQVKDQAERDKTLHGYDMERLRAQMSDKGKGKLDESLASLAELYKDGYLLRDERNGADIPVPASVFDAISTKVLYGLAAKDWGGDVDKMITSSEFKSDKETMKRLLNQYWQQYYDYRVNQDGTVDWYPIEGTKATNPGEMFNFWDYLPGGMPQTSDTTHVPIYNVRQ